VDFESLGAHTCLHMDYADGVEYVYGSREYCSEWMPDVDFVEDTVMEIPIEIPYKYLRYGVFNVTGTALNVVTKVATTDTLRVIVAKTPCKPPYVMIKDNATMNVAPRIYFRSEQIDVTGVAVLNCSGVTNVNKTWSIAAAEVDLETRAEILTPIDLSEIAPDTFQTATILILPLSLEYGVYKLTYNARIWDLDDEDPNQTRNLPFERQASTYVQITPTPLVAALMDSPADFLTRGTKQFLKLEPYLYSKDPDYPDADPHGLAFRFSID